MASEQTKETKKKEPQMHAGFDLDLPHVSVDWKQKRCHKCNKKMWGARWRNRLWLCGDCVHPHPRPLACQLAMCAFNIVTGKPSQVPVQRDWPRLLHRISASDFKEAVLECGSTLFHIAMYGDPELMQALLKKWPQPEFLNARNKAGEAALFNYLSVPNNEKPSFVPGLTNAQLLDRIVASAQLLIQAKADVNAVGAIRRRPLHVAAALPDARVVDLLLQAGAKLNVKVYRSCACIF